MTDLTQRVGARVRKAREDKGIPRRVLSERSGVSPRYIAQLEAGAGNVSITLLERIAGALDHKTEWFIVADNPLGSDAERLAGLYHGAEQDIQAAVMQLLDPVSDETRRAHRVCLLGLRGAGKSTLGELAGAAMNVPFLELNHEIEDHSGLPASEVMALYGPEGYRELEAKSLEQVIKTNDRLVLAVAGGIVAVPETYDTLLNNFHTIWLRATPEEHMARVRAQGDERPMIGYPGALEQLKSILASRETAYDRALVRLETSGKSEMETLKELLTVIEEKQFFAPQ